MKNEDNSKDFLIHDGYSIKFYIHDKNSMNGEYFNMESFLVTSFNIFRM